MRVSADSKDMPYFEALSDHGALRKARTGVEPWQAAIEAARRLFADVLIRVKLLSGTECIMLQWAKIKSAPVPGALSAVVASDTANATKADVNASVVGSRYARCAWKPRAATAAAATAGITAIDA